MSLVRGITIVCVLTVITGAQPDAPVVQDATLRQKQEDQQRARAMTRQLVASVIDFQLRQLEDNGLQDMDIYGEIKSMRTNIDGLVESEMGDVVVLLTNARSIRTDHEREQLFVRARELIRSIVIRLSIERQNLLKRLKTAEIAEQVRRLIEMQSNVLATTKSLPSESTARREQLAIQTIQDQRDVKGLFLQLIETLSDVATWAGPIATGASDGLRALKKAEVGKHLDQADVQLTAAQFSPASVEQAQVILGLRELLKIIIRTQGLIGSDRQAVLDKVKELAERQQELRDETRKAERNSPQEAEVVEKQADIQHDLGELASLLETETEQTHREQAEQAAREATTDLFDGSLNAAEKEQNKVLGHLAALEELLKQTPTSDNSDRSADELASMIEDLEKTRDDLKRIQDEQQDTTETAKADQPKAAKQEDSIANELNQVPKGRELPEQVESRIADAEDAVSEAGDELRQPEQAKRTDQALENAEEAIERALAETEAALADAKRQQAGVEIGELARAAEALERAAAAERQIAKKSDEDANQQGMTAEDADNLSQDQADVDDVAKNVAQGVQHTSPETAKMLDEAMKQTGAVAQQLKQAKQKPGEASKPAAKQAAEHAERAADQLAKSAAQLRRDMGQTAENLIAEADKQLDQLNGVQNPLEQTLAQQQRSQAERLAQLAKAAEQVNQAMQQQQKAAGRPEAADALDLANQIAQAQAKQEEADRAADEVERGAANTPLEATAQQQHVADAAADLAEQAKNQRPADQPDQPTDLENALKTAQEAAAKAAQEILAEHTDAAETARQEAKHALNQAHDMAQQHAEQAAAETPTAPRDANAQEQVGQAAQEAKQLAQDDAADAAKTLEKAAQQSDAAEQHMAAGQEDETHAAQEQVQNDLTQAEQQIADAMDRVANDIAQTARQDAQTSDQLAQQASRVDPGATGALRSAEDAAQRAAERDTPSAEAAQAAENAMQNDLERAAADLAARKQQVEADKAIAEAMKQLAQEQQAAAEQIAEQRDALDTTADTRPVSDVSGTDVAEPPLSAEAALANAAQQFAEAQRATGQGAVEISGQEQVANQPLRDALEMAAELTPESFQAPAPAEAAAAPAQGDAAQENEQANAATAAAPPTPSSELGTGFVPQSPEVTAAMMAGYVELPEALASPATPAAALTAAQAAIPQLATPAVPTPPGTPTAASPATTPPTAVTPSSMNAHADRHGDSQTPNAKRADPKIEERRMRDEAWFAKLPPELRKAIRANARQRAPRTYEERLKRYFESIE